MSETKWTPGPWEVAQDDFDDSFYVRLRDNPDGIGEYIIAAEIGQPTGDDGRADARLIAAAPEMADALRPFASFLDALELMSNYPKTGETHVFESHVVGRRALTVEDFKAARAALAKARGEQP